MSIGIVIEAPELKRLQDRLVLMSRTNFTPMLDGVGAIVESQTRRRIQDEKTTPEGAPWKPWSEKYAASKHGASKGHEPHPGELSSSQGHTMLSLDGGLLDSVQFLVEGSGVEIGSNMIYANHQNSMRQFVGLGDGDGKEVVDIVEDFIDREWRLK